ncbi:MAG: PhzF family phenazine biosynthesis protein [Sphaerochaeta sp.]|nr:PhzF family phenazine biosynthesis protein [Sphaerochaeta sp.]
MQYYHLDVFSKTPLCGNGLTVVLAPSSLNEEFMLKIAQEFKQYETAFIFAYENGAYPVRIFTIQEELAFAGHPILGMAALLHHLHYTEQTTCTIPLRMGERVVNVVSEDTGDHFIEVMDQGLPQFVATLPPEQYKEVCTAMNLQIEDLSEGYPLQVVSTGLPYLLLPVTCDLSKVCVVSKELGKLIAPFGAKFVYVFNTQTLECRTWDNSGLYEDSATGSAAGPLIAYLVHQGKQRAGEIISLKQGKFVGRPSHIQGRVDTQGHVWVYGEVAFFASGECMI